jgi:hypothetical protein
VATVYLEPRSFFDFIGLGEMEASQELEVGSLKSGIIIG